MGRIAGAFALVCDSKRPGLVAYVTAGDPDLARTADILVALAGNGADVLEVGIPFSDPLADGPVIQRASERALASGSTLRGALEMIRVNRSRIDAPIVLFTYANPVLRMGEAEFVTAAAAAWVDGVLVLDLPVEEAGPFRERLVGASLDPIFLLSPTTTDVRIRASSDLGSGFLYVISRRGTTGVRGSLPADLPATVARARRAAGRLPVAVGFGISTESMARAAALLADGVVVGSALVARAEESGSTDAVEKFARGLARACRRSSRRARVGNPG